MAEKTKVVLDGTLFSECEMVGANRDGMRRLTEDITDRLVLNKELEVYFSSNLYIEKYDKALKQFVAKHYPAQVNNIFSKNAPRLSNLLTYKHSLKDKVPFISYSYYKELNKADVYHSFYYPFPDTVLKNKIKRSVTFLDIIALRMNGYPNSLVNRTKKIVDSIASNYAISISEFSKTDLLNYDKRIKEENVFVVPLAASTKLFYPNKERDAFVKLKTKYGLPDNYFLCVSGSDVRKNIPHTVKCFSRFCLQEKPKDISLVLTGNGSHNRAMLDELNISNEVRERIFIPDTFINSDDLAVLYSNAVCFFFMSLYEGFGLPALEAMQCGVPVVTSNTTSLPEVVGDAAISISPIDEDRLSEAMSQVYNDVELRSRLAEAGLKRAATFSWQRCADEYATIFKMISSRPS